MADTSHRTRTRTRTRTRPPHRARAGSTTGGQRAVEALTIRSRTCASLTGTHSRTGRES